MIKVSGAICVLLALSALGCGGGSDSSSTISYRPFEIPLGKYSDRPGRDPENFKPKENGLAGSEPKPIIPDQPPPEFVVSVELIDGSNTPYAAPGDRVTIQYVGAIYDSKKKFASSWDEGKPFTFTIGRGELFKGLEEGLERIELADRREIVIPSEFVTGGSRMQDVPEGEALVYLVEVLKIEDQSGE